MDNGISLYWPGGAHAGALATTLQPRPGLGALYCPEPCLLYPHDQGHPSFLRAQARPHVCGKGPTRAREARRSLIHTIRHGCRFLPLPAD